MYTFPTLYCLYLLVPLNKKKRAKQSKKMMQRGLVGPEKADLFSLLLETERVFENTFGMCILQDLDLLARTIETVEGGGFTILRLQSLSSLAMVMGKAVIDFLQSIMDKSLRSIVAFLAARGCGKSVALSLATAGSDAAGYSNIFVIAPSPENLKMPFDFVCKGINALEYKGPDPDGPELKKPLV